MSRDGIRTVISGWISFFKKKTIVKDRLIIIMILMIDDGMKFAKVSTYDVSVRKLRMLSN